MANAFGIAVLGCGTVGSGVVKLLLEQSERLTQRAGRPLELRHVVVRHRSKARNVNVPGHLLSNDIGLALADSKVDAVVELIGGTTDAKAAIRSAFAARKYVVTANKAVLARFGDEIFNAARATGRAIAFEASVGGGVPMVSTITQALAANQITSLEGILNGTCNFILTQMTEEGWTYQAALAEAQRLGYAEADPKLDVDGSDTADKLAILCRLAFGIAITPDKIERHGIETVTVDDIQLAKSQNCCIKLLADARLDGDELFARVRPTTVSCELPLGRVNGSDNALQIESDAAGQTLVAGPGAGMMPTASAVVADIIDMATGRAQLTFDNIRLKS